jgi:hypothetical protein
MDATLTDLYADLKKDVNTPMIRQSMSVTQDDSGWRNKASNECDKLKETCYKRILLDIYAKIIPLDSSYVTGNMGVMKNDIDSFLQSKNMTATEYLKSCKESTKAPLLEFVIRSCNNIGKAFMEETNEQLKDAKENNITPPLPEADPDAEEVRNQLVDVQSDDEYEGFIDKLKKKTIDKIVNDVSDIINKKKEVDDLSFNPKSVVDSAPEFESTVSVALNHITHQLMKENVEITSDIYDDIVGLAIREATLNIIDQTFKQPMSDFKTFSSKIMYNKGSLINESGIASFLESKGKKKDNDVQLTPKEREFFKDKFPDVGCSFHKDDKGYFCKTHRTRSKSHEKMESLTKKEVDFVSSTS